MEDIKILEEKIKEWEPYKNIDFPTESGKLIQKENQALENLIKEYRKLEEELERQREINTIINKQNLDDNYERALKKTMTKFLNKNIENDYIPKSKVKEKIEELDNMIKEINKRKTSKVHSRRDCSF